MCKNAFKIFFALYEVQKKKKLWVKSDLKKWVMFHIFVFLIVVYSTSGK